MLPADDFIAKVSATVNRYRLIPQGGRVLLALSGGADSVALYHALRILSQTGGFTLSCAHMNHCIRGLSADSDEEFVRKLCESYGTPLYVCREDIPARAKRDGQTLEQAGRIARYQFFDSIGADVIATAHHADDQAESILMHLIRGSGLTGLCGMDYRRGNIIHPLLDVRRAQIESFVTENGFAYVTDATNLCPDAARNKVRLELVPYISGNLNSGFVSALCSMATLLRNDESYLHAQAEITLNDCRLKSGYNRHKLLTSDKPILSRALRIAMFNAGAEKDIEDTHVEAVISLMKNKTGASIDLPYITAFNVYDAICFRKKCVKDQQEAFLFETEFDPRTACSLDCAEKHIDIQRAQGNGFSSDAVYLDLDKLPDSLCLRTRKTGDVFLPLGASGKKKLKDFFIDKKIPREERDCPLICADSTVIGILSNTYYVADAYAVTESTAHTLIIRVSDTTL